MVERLTVNADIESMAEKGAETVAVEGVKAGGGQGQGQGQGGKKKKKGKK
jgi:hypothetical protein